MPPSSRRSYLRKSAGAGLASAALTTFPRWLSGQTTSSSATRIFIDSRRTISPLDRNLFGSFLEHLGRAIYEGIYDPGSKLAESNGFRTDVLDASKKHDDLIVQLPTRNYDSDYI